MAEFPTSVRIGYHDFTVEEWDVTAAAFASRYGECDHLKKTIRVSRAHGDRKAAETLVHETLHAIFNEWVIQKEDDEERIVSTLSGAICAVWRQNPKAFEWIREQVTA